MDLCITILIIIGVMILGLVLFRKRLMGWIAKKIMAKMMGNFGR